MIGVFGGTFDPPHLGHSILADLSCDQLGLERVLWVPVGDPPHKPDGGLRPPAHRAAMVLSATSGDERFELSRVDLDRPRPHYTADSMQILRQQLPGEQLAYLMGSDSLADLPNWHEPRRFVEACDVIGVLRRPGAQFDVDALEAILPGLIDRLRTVDAPLIQISGSDIRARARAGRSYRYFVLPQVFTYIHQAELYR